MKPKNFPARKLARQLAAASGVSARAILSSPTAEQRQQLDTARVIRSKKKH
jgi:hypothetical protein